MDAVALTKTLATSNGTGRSDQGYAVEAPHHQALHDPVWGCFTDACQLPRSAATATPFPSFSTLPCSKLVQDNRQTGT
eukprot:5545290-Amphidinium_carterae.1